DPFWRVRFAALQGLSLLVLADEKQGDARGADDALREAALAERAGVDEAADAAMRYLALALDAAPLEALEAAEQAARRAPLRRDLPPPRHPLLADADPAVVTAQLETLDVGALDARELVGLLADSHRALRRVAVRRLEQLIATDETDGAVEALTLALGWLDEPRVPHAAEAVRSLLSRLDRRADALASAVLREAAARVERGAAITTPLGVAWACERAARRRIESLRPQLRTLVAASDAAACDEPWTSATRALGGLLVAGEREREGARDDDDEARTALLASLTARRVALRAAAIDALAELADEASLAALSQCRLLGLAADGQRRPHLADVALVQAWVRRRLSEPLGAALRERPLAERPASVAAALLDGATQLSLSDDVAARREEALRAPDPWVRAAAYEAPRAAEALGADATCGEDNPLARRAALLALLPSLAADAAQRTRWASRLAGEADAFMRSRAARLLDASGDEGLAVALRLAHDEEPMVRAWAASALECCDGDDDDALAPRLDVLLGGDSLDTHARLSAYSQRLRGPGDVERLRAALAEETDPRLREHLETIALAIDDAAADRALALATRERERTARERAARPRPRERTQPALAARALWRGGPEITPLVLSGANDLHEGSLRVASEAGVDTFFWEPTYRALTPFLARRPELRVIAGSYNADPRGVARDLERARRVLGRDRIDVFLLFWARSPARVGSAAYEMMAKLKKSGRVGAIGFSSHHRDIAADAIARDPWDAVMVRHSAAHTGAEAELLPLARARGTSVLTFSALCYGRMLRAVPGTVDDGAALPTAVDCYRYNLSQPGVSAVISAPRRHAELLANLGVLEGALGEEALDEVTRGRLLAHGARVRAHNHAFNRFVRRGDVWGTPREVALRWLDEQQAQREQEDPR
ncbi:MAG: aldo/keto reductase, partial [Myxococcales bacterium]|nr:aldo/keto reductase [Myxococcales bacterium]